MSNCVINLLPMGAITCGVIFCYCAEAIAQSTSNYSNDLGQVTNVTTRVEHAETSSAFPLVNQLTDIAPTDWAYEALRSLVDRYSCISGFPDQTYRGGQPLSRYEFAAGLNSCLNQIERLIASSESVSSEDIATIQRLSQEFAAELTTLRGRVDEIDSRTAALEDSSFSTTTKLNAEIVNYVLGTFGDAKPDGSDIDNEI
ncbi:MAG: hypothetical protein RLZZ535_2899, partial [Cyanobacteriota bacterium]